MGGGEVGGGGGGGDGHSLLEVAIMLMLTRHEFDGGVIEGCGREASCLDIGLVVEYLRPT